MVKSLGVLAELGRPFVILNLIQDLQLGRPQTYSFTHRDFTHFITSLLTSLLQWPDKKIAQTLMPGSGDMKHTGRNEKW